MSNWEDFEIECTSYLNSKFSTYANFKHMGGADSTKPDILVQLNDGTRFFMEAKQTPAQCGQFVLIPDIERRCFAYSEKNASRINQYAKEIMKHMDKQFDEYREAGTSGKSIEMPDSDTLFTNWIVDYYKNKGVKYFITNDYTIFPIDAFGNHFDVSATYRIKRSGSGEVGKPRLNIVKDYILSLDYAIDSVSAESGKLFIESRRNLHNQRFILGKYEYMFSQRGDRYEIRKLSNTYNANVIFSIIKKNAAGLSDSEFIDSIYD